MVIVLRKKKLFILLVILFVLIICLGTYFAVRPAFSPNPSKVIVIDAGHGGIDGGGVGVATKNDENHLNLEYSQCLKEYCENFGFKVIMTRTTLDGLYDITAKNKKKSDMKKRKEIIDNSNADLVVSLHMNSFPSKSAKGAQVFFNKENASGKVLAQSIQNSFLSTLPNAKKSASSGDYFIVNCTSLPAVIVECGYLSNPEEDLLLSSEEYKRKVCYLIFCGILNFL